MIKIIKCGKCPDLLIDQQVRSKKELEINAKKRGWRQSDDYIWLCPVCFRNRIRNLQRNS